MKRLALLAQSTFLAALFAALFAAACSSPSETVPLEDAGAGGSLPAVVTPTPAPAGEPYDTLEPWHLFTDAQAGKPAEGVIPYDVVAPLFSDYTKKSRYLWVPPGKKIGYHDTDRWDLPIGSILIKVFAYPVDERAPEKGDRVLETRLLVREPDGWIPHTYVWDEANTEAVRTIAGERIEVSWVDAAGATKHNSYEVPNTNVCLECHGKVGITGPLGPRTRQLNRDGAPGLGNQIDHLDALGLLAAKPAPAADRQVLVDPFGKAPLVDRARSYLDANCSHCHGVVGLAKGTAFWLDWDHTDPVKGNPIDWGVCKVPASAGAGACGLGFDVVPGHAELSIVPCRVASLDPKVAMPPVGHQLVHDEGLELVKAWIDGMPEMLCQ